jgi:hypothetical protein
MKSNIYSHFKWPLTYVTNATLEQKDQPDQDPCTKKL